MLSFANEETPDRLTTSRRRRRKIRRRCLFLVGMASVVGLSVANLVISGRRQSSLFLLLNHHHQQTTENNDSNIPTTSGESHSGSIIQPFPSLDNITTTATTTTPNTTAASASAITMRKRGVFTATSRAAQVTTHHQQALLSIQEFQNKYPFLNLTDLLVQAELAHGYTSSSSYWTPALVENIVEARRYHYFSRNTNNTNMTSSSSNSHRNALIHFVSHIPKTGVTYGASLLVRFAFSSPQRQQQQQHQSLWSTTTTQQQQGQEGYESRFRPCDFGRLQRFDDNTISGMHNDMVCTLWISEQPRPVYFRYGYTLIRNPRHHVISQYFHCKESRPHRNKAHFMPDTLTEWLLGWVETSKREGIDVGGLRPPVRRARAAAGPGAGEDGDFKCYDPRNLQTTFTKFSYSDWRRGGNREWNRTKAKADLEKRFQVLGLTERTAQSMCLIAIRFTGWVPPKCDCTDIMINQEQSKANNTDADYTIQDENRNSNITLVQGKSHGVEHHGATYVTTPTEDALLDELTQWDQKLYDLAQELFWERLIDTEYEYGVRICEDVRTDIDFHGRPYHQHSSSISSHAPCDGCHPTNPL